MPGELGLQAAPKPLARLTEKRMKELGPDLLAAARELAATSNGSSLFANRA